VDSGSVSKGGSVGSGGRRAPFPKATLANYEARAKELRITLPSLCTCHTLSPLDPNYVHTCSRNCPLYRNPTAWQGLILSMLGTYGLL
jgi:hypothetical protein